MMFSMTPNSNDGSRSVWRWPLKSRAIHRLDPNTNRNMAAYESQCSVALFEVAREGDSNPLDSLLIARSQVAISIAAIRFGKSTIASVRRKRWSSSRRSSVKSRHLSHSARDAHVQLRFERSSSISLRSNLSSQCFRYSSQVMRDPPALK